MPPATHPMGQEKAEDALDVCQTVNYGPQSMDCNLSGFSVHGSLHARILEWVAMLSSRRFSQLRDQTCVSCTAGRFFTTEPLGKPK